MNSDWLTVFEALKSVYADEAYSNMAINEALFHHKGCKESFVRNYTKGVLRETIKLDYLIDKLAARGIKKVALRPLIILRMGVYAINSLDSIPDHAAVSEAVDLSKKVAKGSAGFINAVLRTYLRKKDDIKIPKDRLDIKYSMNEGLVSLIEEQYPEEGERIFAALNEPPETVIRVNTLRADRNSVIARLEYEGIKAEASDESENAVIASGSGIIASDLYKAGLISVQSLSSMLAIEALSPKEGSSVLDMCAAPGGKSAYMAELMGNNGRIIACDIHRHRLGLIEKSMKRLGIEIVEPKLADASVFNKELEESFDYVLSDVPCSGLGVMASKPELKFRSDPSEYEQLIKLQKRILKNALLYAKEGGKIEYSTCTLNRNENERVVEDVMKKSENGLIRILEMKTLMPYNCKVGFFYCLMEKNHLSDR